jgi:hypothetical protein
MHERTENERKIVFLEIIHELHKAQREGELPEGFVPTPLLALAINKVAEALYPDGVIKPNPPLEKEIPRVNKFPPFAPAHEQGIPKTNGKNQKEIIEIPFSQNVGKPKHTASGPMKGESE